MNKQRGITLIALVITIIVLLILAGVSLSFVLGNNGVLTQSKTSVTENKKATAKEEVTMAWAACETDYSRAWAEDSSVNKADFFEGNNGNPGLSSYLTTGTLTNFLYGENSTLDYEKSASEKYHITINNKGEVISIVEVAQQIEEQQLNSGENEGEQIADLGSDPEEQVNNPEETVITEPGSWVQNGTTITNSATNQTLKVGDQVYYNSGVTEYEGSGEIQGKWGVLGAEDGKLLLLSSEYIQDSFTLSGKQGYFNGITQLNNICTPYKNETYATEARCIEVKDIDRIFNETPFLYAQSDTYRKIDGKVYANSYIGYGTSTQTTFEDVNGNVLNNSNSITVEGNRYLDWVEFEDIDDEKVVQFIAGEGFLTEPYYYEEWDWYEPGYFVWTNPKTYWLANSWVSCECNAAAWGLMQLDYGNIQDFYLWHSYEFGRSLTYGVRAVVCLKSDVVLSGNSSNGWNISLSE